MTYFAFAGMGDLATLRSKFFLVFERKLTHLVFVPSMDIEFVALENWNDLLAKLSLDCRERPKLRAQLGDNIMGCSTRQNGKCGQQNTTPGKPAVTRKKGEAHVAKKKEKT